MNSTNLTGQMITSRPEVMLAVADVIGRTDKRALRSVAGTVELPDVFNCLSTLRRATRYITNESGEISFRVTTWNGSKLATYMDLLSNSQVDGLEPTQGERESLRILSGTLRNNHEQQS